MAGSSGQGGAVRTRKKDATRRRLMDAAGAVFAEKGYAATTVDDIVQRAGTSPATFYLHFKRKVDVLIAGLAEEDQAVWLVSEPLLPGAGPLTRDGVAGWLRRLFDTWQHLEATRLALSQAVLIEPELRAQQSARLAGGIEFWEALLHDLGRPPGTATQAQAAVLNAQIYGLFEMWIVYGVGVDVDAALEATTDALWARLGPPPGAQKAS
ncbi:MAG TPA: TetR/AcrR family transcriptional regulator [Acidimicrobiales bacterium]|nr:TetR/AcrR family transcriptional regulator [Acidimicrobiales bacterium]